MQQDVANRMQALMNDPQTKDKPMSEYLRDKRTQDGKMYTCRECTNKYNSEYKKKRKHQEIVAFDFYE